MIKRVYPSVGKMNNIFIKNFYYNRTTIIKLLHFYYFLNNVSFFDELITKLKLSEFSNTTNDKTELLLQIYESLTPNFKKFELNFGYVLIFENKVIFYFKKDFLYEDFFKFFEKLNDDFGINWLNLELYDKNVKILEIFKDNGLIAKPFLRSFREETVQGNLIKKSKKIKKICIDVKSKDFLFFIKNYNENNLKLILNYAS